MCNNNISCCKQKAEGTKSSLFQGFILAWQLKQGWKVQQLNDGLFQPSVSYVYASASKKLSGVSWHL